MIVEALTSLESFSNSLSRRMSELKHSVDDRLGLALHLLNGLLESCHRIQEKGTLIEDRIYYVLERMLDSVDNRLGLEIKWSLSLWNSLE